MALGSSIRAGAAYVELTVDNTLLMRGLKQAQSQLKAFGATVSSWGRDLAKISAVALAPLALSAHTFSDAASAMARVRGITGATAEEFQALYDLAKRLARDGIFSAKDIATGMETLGKRGLAPKEIMAAIGPVMGLARIAGSDLPSAADMATAAMRAFGLEAGDIGHIIDVTAAAARAGKTDVNSISEALAAAGPAARVAGASLEDTAAAIAVLTKNGITGARAGQALAMAYRRLSSESIQDKLAGVDTSGHQAPKGARGGSPKEMESRVNMSAPTAGAKKALDDLNISVTDTKGNMRSLGDILAELMKKTAGMTQPQRAAVFSAVFGRSQVAMLALVNGKLGETQKAMQNTNGAAKAMAANMGEDHIAQTGQAIARVANDCGIRRLRDIERAKVERWLLKQAQLKMSARTRNTYRIALVAFGNWCVREGRLLNNPFAGLPRANEAADRRRERRALTMEEIGKLLKAANERPLYERMLIRRGKDKGQLRAKVNERTKRAMLRLGRERAMFYRIAIYTGLRVSEVASLTLADLHLDVQPPHVTLHARHDKARRGARQPLPDDLVQAIRQYLAVRLRIAQENAIAFGTPTMIALAQDEPLIAEVPALRVFDRDLETAGIEKKDQWGRTVDLHSLRHTFGTMLARSGVNPRTAMELMRHSDIRLTTNIYQHLELVDTAGAVNQLPVINAANANSPLRQTGTTGPATAWSHH